MTISTVTVSVPAMYELRAIKKRCQKPTNLGVKTTVDAQIKTADPDDVKPAFIIKGIMPEYPNEQEIFRIDGKLYCPATRENATEVRNPTGLCGCPFYQPGRYTSEANWPEGDNSFRTFSLDSPLLHLEHEIDRMQLRSKIRDNKADIARLIEEMASAFVLVGDTLYRRIGEPYYYVSALGMGNNHGGTATFSGLATHDGKTPGIEKAFNALQRDEAIAYADSVAKNRGDTKSVGNKPLNEIVVLDKTAVTLPAFKAE